MSRTLLVMQPPGVPFGPLPGVLARNLPETAIHRYRSDWTEDFNVLTPEHRGRMLAIKGDFFFGLHELIANACDYVVYLSNPVDAALRVYAERWRSGDSELPFEDFIRLDESGKADNQAVALILGRPAESSAVEQTDVAAALDHLRRYFLHVGIVEEAEADLPELAAALGWPAIYLNPDELRLPESPAVSAATFELLRQRNQPGIALFEQARQLARSRRKPTTPRATVMSDVPPAIVATAAPATLDGADCLARPCLIFLHVPKTAGVSVTQALRRCVPEAHTLAGPEDHSAVRLFSELPPDRQRSMRLIYGHMPYGLHQNLPGDWRYLIILRNPLARIMSAYRYYRNYRNSYLHDFIADQNISFRQYVMSGIDRSIDNLQARYLAGDPTIFEGGRRFVGGVDDSVFTEASRHLSDAKVIAGTTGNLEAAMVLLGMEVGYQPYVVETLNTSGGQELVEWDAETLAAACLHNRYDIALYRKAHQLTKQRIMGAGPAYPERLNSYRQRVDQMRDKRSGAKSERIWLRLGTVPVAYLVEFHPGQYRFHMFSGSLIELEGRIYASEAEANVAIRQALPVDFVMGHLEEERKVAESGSQAVEIAGKTGAFRLIDPYDELLERGLTLVGDILPSLD